MFKNKNLLLNYGARNSTRMAPYHRLDISATWYDKAFKIKTDAITGQEIKVKRDLDKIGLFLFTIFITERIHFSCLLIKMENY